MLAVRTRRRLCGRERLSRGLKEGDPVSPPSVASNVPQSISVSIMHRELAPAVMLLLHLSLAIRPFIDWHLARFVRSTDCLGRVIHPAPNRPFARESRFYSQTQQQLQQQRPSFSAYLLNYGVAQLNDATLQRDGK